MTANFNMFILNKVKRFFFIILFYAKNIQYIVKFVRLILDFSRFEHDYRVSKAEQMDFHNFKSLVRMGELFYPEYKFSDYNLIYFKKKKV